jgi:hypothetical protein
MTCEPADARLIAAAPRLLKALQNMVNNDGANLREAIDAISEATGQGVST